MSGLLPVHVEPQSGAVAVATTNPYCDLRDQFFCWGQEQNELPVEARADAAAAIGVDDPARGDAPVNEAFAVSFDQLVSLLVTLAVEGACCPGLVDTVEPAAQVAAFRVNAALTPVTTGDTLWATGLWKPLFTRAHATFTSREMRALYGVEADPDPGASPVIRRVLRDVPFDAVGLFAEWQARDTIFDFVAAALGNGDLSAPLEDAAQAAVTLRVLEGRFDPAPWARRTSGSAMAVATAGPARR
jgi:hypothetical protein